MTERLTIALAQINPTVGDVSANIDAVRAARAVARDADLVLFPELVVSGYPPEDLVLRPAFMEAVTQGVTRLAEETRTGGPALLLPCPWRDGDRVRNAVLLLDGHGLEARYKHELPNYGVFDEKRVFDPGPLPEPVLFRGVSLGLPICEDIWVPTVVRHLRARGAELFLVPNGSPFDVDKPAVRMDLARARVAETGCPLIYVNQVGGQDELVFDGGSFVLNADRTVAALLPSWTEEVASTTWRRTSSGWRCDVTAQAAPQARSEAMYTALVLGLRDYVRKNRFPGIVLGLSGGIDSAVSAAVAVDALGPARVIGVRLPSVYTSALSLDDAAACAEALGIRLETLPIADAVAEVERVLSPLFAGLPRDVTEENVQARVRGLLLMALSNKFGHMLLTTGNKSEMSVGYATLYGDMCGGYSVLKDVYKTDVYALARWRNGHRPPNGIGPRGVVIPASTIERPPTAELRPNQTDQDSLPPYDELDAILRGLVEEERSVNEIAARGHDAALVERVQHLLFLAEYKRRQAPPGVKLGRRSFGRDRRYPITNRFRDTTALSDRSVVAGTRSRSR